jgi:hypothetical protein
MPRKTTRRIGMWLAIVVGIAAASMSASKHHKVDRPTSTANGAAAHITLILPLN